MFERIYEVICWEKIKRHPWKYSEKNFYFPDPSGIYFFAAIISEKLFSTTAIMVNYYYTPASTLRMTINILLATFYAPEIRELTFYWLAEALFFLDKTNSFLANYTNVTNWKLENLGNLFVWPKYKRSSLRLVCMISQKDYSSFALL